MLCTMYQMEQKNAAIMNAGSVATASCRYRL